MPLDSQTRRALRARAHALKTVVTVGIAGLTASVLTETERALDAHELIKLRFQHGDRKARAATLSLLCSELGAEPVQTIGRVAVIWRQRSDPPSPDARARVGRGHS